MSDLHHPYDKAARHAAKHSGARLLPFLFPNLALDVMFVRWADARSQPDPSGEDRTCDVVAELRDPQKPGCLQAVIIEFQARPRGDESSRGFEYATRVQFELSRQEENTLAYEAFAAFVFLTGRAVGLPIASELRGTRARTEHQSEWFSMAEADLQTFLSGIAADPTLHVLLYWAPLMKGADDPAKIQEWLRLAKTHFPKPLRSNLRIVALTFAELTGRASIWINFLKDWNVGESLLLRQWTAEAEAKAAAKALQATFLRIVANRFPAEDVQTLRKKVRSEVRAETLNVWIDTAVAAKSADDLRKALGL